MLPWQRASSESCEGELPSLGAAGQLDQQSTAPDSGTVADGEGSFTYRLSIVAAPDSITEPGAEQTAVRPGSGKKVARTPPPKKAARAMPGMTSTYVYRAPAPPPRKRPASWHEFIAL